MIHENVPLHCIERSSYGDLYACLDCGRKEVYGAGAPSFPVHSCPGPLVPSLGKDVMVSVDKNAFAALMDLWDRVADEHVNCQEDRKTKSEEDGLEIEDCELCTLLHVLALFSGLKRSKKEEHRTRSSGSVPADPYTGIDPGSCDPSL